MNHFFQRVLGVFGIDPLALLGIEPRENFRITQPQEGRWRTVSNVPNT